MLNEFVKMLVQVWHVRNYGVQILVFRVGTVSELVQHILVSSNATALLQYTNADATFTPKIWTKLLLDRIKRASAF